MITVGIDEVGRGCWAGPMVAGAVILSATSIWKSPPKDDQVAVDKIVLRDSKKMSKRQREVSAEWILIHAIATGIGWVWPAEIDEYGVTWAVKTAMERALGKIVVDYDEVIVDGNVNYFPVNTKARAIIKADDSIPAASAASIIAKVARDSYMAELGAKYAGYGFADHVGYGTAKHIAALNTLGVSDIHRRSYKPIKALLI